MESKNINQVMCQYLQDMLKLYNRDVPPKINAYCAVLKDLLYTSLDFLPVNVSKDDIVIEILEIPVDLRIHIPLIRILDGKEKVYGYIDVLSPGTKKKNIKSYLFLDLYKQLFPNLIITDFFEFLYYRDAQKVCRSRPFSASYIGELTDKTKVKSSRLFIKELQLFMNYRDKKSIATGFIELQQQLALKTFYLKEFILVPLMKHVVYKDIKGELFRLYRAYCYFFNRELSIKEFSSFLSHLIIDGFLRAGIFYNKFKQKKGNPLSRLRVYKCSKFNKMSSMRLEVLKYFSQAPGDDKIIVVVQWLLDEICVLLENFDFKKIDILGENPMSINGALLQLEDYFFKPYYENEDYKVVLEMLKNAEIFSGEINTEKLEKLSEPKKKKFKYNREE